MPKTSVTKIVSNDTVFVGWPSSFKKREQQLACMPLAPSVSNKQYTNASVRMTPIQPHPGTGKAPLIMIVHLFVRVTKLPAKTFTLVQEMSK